jgi:gluconokinase
LTLPPARGHGGAPDSGAPPHPGAPGGCVLVLDVGSSSARAVLYDASARAVGREARAAHAWRAPEGGGMETDAEALFGEVVRVVDAGVEEARALGAEIVAVAAAAFWHSLLGVDAAGVPLTPLYGWGEMRPAAAALRLRERLDEGEVHRRTGCFFHPGYPAAKLLWLRRAAAVTFPRVAAWMSFGEYLEMRLFGVRRCSLSMASGTGLLALGEGRWDAEMLAVLGVAEEQLSPLVDTDAPTPALLPEWARRWPELAGVPWIPPLGDGACANAGSGAVGGDRVAITVGTSAAVRTLCEGERPAVPPGLWCYLLDRRRWVMGRALSNGGNTAAFLRASLRLPPPEEMEAAVATLEPDAHGLTVVPSLLGERAPGWEAWSGAAVLGMTQATHPVEVLRAWMEAVAFRITAAVRALEGALGPAREVIAGGGALHASPTWVRILADALGRPLTLSAEPEETSRGAALVALERLGVIAGLGAAPPAPGERVEPDPARHARYRAARARQEAAEALLAAFHT